MATGGSGRGGWIGSAVEGVDDAAETGVDLVQSVLARRVGDEVFLYGVGYGGKGLADDVDGRAG